MRICEDEVNVTFRVCLSLVTWPVWPGEGGTCTCPRSRGPPPGLAAPAPAPPNMPRELLEISLSRAGARQPWGFRIIGGRDEGRVCRVEKVNKVLKIFPDILACQCNVGFLQTSTNVYYRCDRLLDCLTAWLQWQLDCQVCLTVMTAWLLWQLDCWCLNSLTTDALTPWLP